MAETAKILSPDKTVLIPDLDAGCLLAASITADQLREWKAEHHPGATVVSYVNTTAEVKSESDYCCTSGNAKAIIDAVPRTRRSSSCPTSTSASGWRRSRAASSTSGWASATSTPASDRPTSSAGSGRARRRVPRPPRVRLREPVLAFGNDNTYILGTEHDQVQEAVAG